MIEKMLKENPTDSFLNYAAALEFNKNGNKTQAIEVICKVLKNDPEYLGGYYQLGKLYEETNQLLKAIETYKKGKVIAEHHNDTKTVRELSEALLNLEDEDI